MKYKKYFTIFLFISFTYFLAIGQTNKGLILDGTQSTPLKAKQRCALVIGNSRYSGLGFLKNPANDADSMARALKKLGFEVTEYKDLDKRRFREVVNAFGESMRDYEVCLFYYSGHGAEAKGINYLFPVDAAPASESDVEFDCMPVNLVLGKMDDARIKTKIVLLDACRNNPFQRSWHRSGGGGGLAEMTAPNGTFIGFAAGPGFTASDGKDNNGPYTKAIIGEILKPNLSISDIFTNVNAAVRKITGGEQVPFMNSSLEDVFFFSKNNNSPAPPGSASKTDLANTGPATATWPTPKPNAVIAITDPVAGSGSLSKSERHTIEKMADTIESLMVPVRGGSFMMGCTSEQGDCSSDEKPAHNVILNSFYISKYDITQEQWNAVMSSNPSKPANCPNCPVNNVSWNDAMKFIARLNEMSGKSYRLPTEAEWEYAARGGYNSPGYRYAGSNDIHLVAWYLASSLGPRPVGQKKPNELGLYDMTGDVSQWCNDWYDKKYYNNSPTNNPHGAISGDSRVFRGGSFLDDKPHSRVSNRGYDVPDKRSITLGFRLVHD